MNVNMKLSKEELNDVFETLLKTAITNNVVLNFNIDLAKPSTPVVTTKGDVETVVTLDVPQTKVHLEEDNKVTLSRCLDCGCVQAVNKDNPTCYVCGDDLPTDARPYDGNCTSCGEEIHLAILGTGVDYVSCNSCKKKHTIKLDFTQTKWINKY